MMNNYRKPHRISGLKYDPKLNWVRVNHIRRTYIYRSRKSGLDALAKYHGVSKNTIHKVVIGKVWKVTENDGNVPAPEQKRYENMFSWPNYVKAMIKLEKLGLELEKSIIKIQKK